MQRLVAATLCVAAVHFAAGPSGRCAAGLPADIIFLNGKIVTLDPKRPAAAALAIAGGLIVAVGSDRQVQALRGPSTRVVDLSGKTVIPGLQDSHIHFIGLGRDITRRADFTFSRNAEDILQGVRALARKIDAKPKEWLLGSRWDQYKYPAMATRWQLDEIAPDNLVRLGRTYRGVLVNTAVFRLMGIDDERSSTWPAWWLKDPPDFTFEDKILRAKRTVTVDGVTREIEIPTGVFLGSKGTRLVTARPPASTFEDDAESVRLGVEEMLRLGVTAIVEGDSPRDYNMRVYEEAHNRGQLLIRVPGVYFGSIYRQTPEEIVRLLQPVDMSKPSDDYLRWRGVKFYADGGVGTRSAWVSESFVRWQELEHRENHGQPEIEDDAVREEQFRAVADLGWDLHTHACGDVAMRQTVKLYVRLLDEIRKKQPQANPRWSVVHAYMPIEPKTAMLADMARYRIIAVPNPPFNWQQGDGFATNAGAERMVRLQPFRSYLKAGVVMASGSDYPIVTHDPWIGIYALLTRRDQKTGRVYGPGETIGILDALRSYSSEGAYLTYDEKTRGTLQEGKLADLVVLDLTDIALLEKNPELCFQMKNRILETIVGGVTRYRRRIL